MTSMWTASSDVDYDYFTGNSDRWEHFQDEEEEEDPRSTPSYIAEWDAWAAEQKRNEIRDTDFAESA